MLKVQTVNVEHREVALPCFCPRDDLCLEFDRYIHTSVEYIYINM